jgi:hypothetical protein
LGNPQQEYAPIRGCAAILIRDEARLFSAKLMYLQATFRVIGIYRFYRNGGTRRAIAGNIETRAEEKETLSLIGIGYFISLGYLTAFKTYLRALALSGMANKQGQG